jgi:hypothetical protein
MVSERLRFWLGGALALAAVFALVRGIPGLGADHVPLDPERAWQEAKVPDRAATPFERRLGEIASVVAGRSVQVRCEDFSNGNPVEPGGVVQFRRTRPADFARIRPDECTRLTRFPGSSVGAAACFARHRCSRNIFEAAEAVTVLAHESYHLHGVRSEAVTQCYAMQAVPRVARALGAAEDDSRALATLEYVGGYPLMPDNYRSPDCRPFGKLDLTRDGRWP